MPYPRERKSTRLHQYDYSMPDAYFITACTKNRELLFETSQSKLAVESAWCSLLDIFANIELGEFVIMPNHIHGILWIVGEGAYRLHRGILKNDDHCKDERLPVPTVENIKFETLSNMIGAFKTTAATRINKLRGMIGVPVWQRSFYDRIVREPRELACIQKYIENNPINGQMIGIIQTALNLVYKIKLSMIHGMRYLIYNRREQQLLFPTVV